jgi:MtN3 and saliva related transmembrane protein
MAVLFGSAEAPLAVLQEPLFETDANIDTRREIIFDTTVSVFCRHLPHRRDAMAVLEAIPLVASIMATVAPAMQVVHIFRTRSVEGLSALTCIALVIGNCLAILLGVQYHFGVVLVVMITSLLIQAVMLHLVSWRLSLKVWLTIVAVCIAISTLAPTFATDLLTTRYNEPVAFVWGLIAATTFIPQVLRTRRTRQVQDLSLVTIICFAIGFSLWSLFAWLVQNWSLLLWCSVLTLSVYELLRLKFTIKPAAVVIAAAG